MKRDEKTFRKGSSLQLVFCGVCLWNVFIEMCFVKNVFFIFNMLQFLVTAITKTGQLPVLS